MKLLVKNNFITIWVFSQSFGAKLKAFLAELADRQSFRLTMEEEEKEEVTVWWMIERGFAARKFEKEVVKLMYIF